MRSVAVPLILVIAIESAIWLNLAVPYFSGSTVFYIAYLIISSIQLGATVDYAILITDRYKENRQRLDRRGATAQTIADTAVSVMTSGSVLAAVGLLLSYISSNQLLAQLGLLIGRGALFSLRIVLFILPGLLGLFDRFVVPRRKRKKAASALAAKLTESAPSAISAQSAPTVQPSVSAPSGVSEQSVSTTHYAASAQPATVAADAKAKNADAKAEPGAEAKTV